MKKLLHRQFILLMLISAIHYLGIAQVTTSSFSGIVTDENNEPLLGANVVATHTPSGTFYGSVTNESGYYFIPGVRVGGPYKLVISYTGFQESTFDDIFTKLGVATTTNVILESGVDLGEVVITASGSDIFSGNRTGAASTFSKELVNNLPAIGSRSITNITKYNPNGNGSNFGGQDSRLNNFTIDGSPFNNAFGLGSATEAGSRTGSTAISLDAIQELQVNVAPFDVRQSGFVGAGLNAVTRSGSNDMEASVFRNWRNGSKTFIGRTAEGRNVAVGDFDESVIGGRIGGPIIKNKVFFFLNAEMVKNSSPGTSWVADGSSNPGQVTRVLKSDLDQLSSYLRSNYQWESGAYEAFNNDITSSKLLGRFDFNLGSNNKLTLRYIHHDSQAEIPISNSASAGVGNRRDRFDAMSFKNSGYLIQDNTRSVVADLNTNFSNSMFNNLIVGFDRQIEDRALIGTSFPTVDILKEGRTYISFGLDPFTPSNKLNYNTFHITDNLTILKGKSTWTFGAKAEFYKSNNNFFPASNGVYVFNSLEDFYSASDFALQNSGSTTSPVEINRFQYRYSALPGAADPVQVLKATRIDFYGQNSMQVNPNFTVTGGIRASVITMGNTALENPVVTTLEFADIEENRGYKINTGQMPKAQFLVEPRLGFNYNLKGDNQTQIRGGLGVFTGRPPYVWISNQIGNNGILTGFIDARNTMDFPFTSNTAMFTPDSPTLPSTIDIAASDPNYKFPQIFKSNIAVDQRIGNLLIASAEILYNRNVNAINYWNANLENPKYSLTGADNRPYFGDNNGERRINDNVSNAIVMTNTNQGGLFQTSVKLEHPFRRGFYGMFAYTFSRTRDLQDAGSIAFGSWAGVPQVRGANNLNLSYSTNDIPHRVIGLFSYSFAFGDRVGTGTTLSLGYVGEKSGRFSYTSAGDLNGDGVSGNELVYVPGSVSEITFEDLKVGDVVYTPAQQQAALDAFINQHDYLSGIRGQYAERNGGVRPFLSRFDLSIAQDVFVGTGSKRNKLQFRVDILNFANMLSDEWGVGTIVNGPQLLSYKRQDNQTPVYTLATQRDNEGNTILVRDTFSSSVSLSDVWNMQFGIRYSFGR